MINYKPYKYTLSSFENLHNFYRLTKFGTRYEMKIMPLSGRSGGSLAPQLLEHYKKHCCCFKWKIRADYLVLLKEYKNKPYKGMLSWFNFTHSNERFSEKFVYTNFEENLVLYCHILLKRLLREKIIPVT